MKMACLLHHTTSSTVRMRVFWITVLLWNLNLPFLHSLTCDERKEYQWPSGSPNKCCNKCKPGEIMAARCREGSRNTECKPCSKGMYISVYNALSRCDACQTCGLGQEELKACTTSTNTECRCMPGHRCIDADCSDCVEERPKVTTTTITTPPTTTTVSTTTDVKQPEWTTLAKEPDDAAVLLPVVLIVCVCILLLIIATQLRKLEPLGCCTFDDSSSKDTQSTEEETLRLPEVCTDLQEVWIKDGSDHLNGQVTEGILC
ncbi:tumor necrosis factor receptor superfamily member 5 isoform X1 [Alosa alosa]|nr:tumor necrosis factor receptor superfamily member 5 isoform X1 [Alosa alosa]